MENLKLYSSHCPKCDMIEKILNEKGITFELVDDEKVYLPIADKNNIDSMPFAEINGKIFNIKDLQEYIKNRG